MDGALGAGMRRAQALVAVWHPCLCRLRRACLHHRPRRLARVLRLPAAGSHPAWIDPAARPGSPVLLGLRRSVSPDPTCSPVRAHKPALGKPLRRSACSRLLDGAIALAPMNAASAVTRANGTEIERIFHLWCRRYGDAVKGVAP